MTLYKKMLSTKTRWDLIAYETSKSPYQYVDTLYANGSPVNQLVLEPRTEIWLDIPENTPTTDISRPSWVVALEA